MSTHDESPGTEANTKEDGEVFAALLRQPGHDPNFLPIEADHAMAAEPGPTDFEIAETMGEPGHDPNFLPIELRQAARPAD